MTHLVIYNPNASNGKALKRLKAVKSQLSSAGILHDIILTEEPGHATRLARENAGRYDVLVAAGGDGTIHEVINGIMMVRKAASAIHSPISALGVLCTGRGNDFAHGAGVPRNLTAACAALKTGVRKHVDVGLVIGDGAKEGRYFGNGLGIGFDAIVSIEASKIGWAQGFVGYLIGAIKTIFFFYDPPVLRLKTDTVDEQRPLLQISVMIGRRMGGAFYMAPQASNSDGLFDICIAGEPTRREMLGLVAKFMKGSQEGARHIEFHRTARLEVTSAGAKIVMHADGETICTSGSKVSVEIVHCGLEIISPSTG